MPSRKGWVLALLPEASRSWAARVRAYCDFHELETVDDFLCCIQQNDLADSRTWQRVVATIEEQTARRGDPPVLVIVDTLSASIPGHDENSQAEMTRLTSHLQMPLSMGVCVILSHHTSKHGRSYRGSSVIHGACDWMISVVPTRTMRELVAVKLRDAEGIASVAFQIVPHGESAVCVTTDEDGPWGAFDAATRDHPGLRAAFLEHGFQVPGDECTRPAEGDIKGAGVSLKVLQTTWNRLDPITPTNAEDAEAYKAVHGARKTALIRLADLLRNCGVLQVTMGVLSRKSRGLSVVVRQVVDDDE